ncbi:MAG: DUF1761 domain-containing protein [Methylotenera sp.]
MQITSILIAGVAYFVLGGLWFTPLFGKQWDKAVGFERPIKWRPSTIYYIGPLAGCLAASFAMSILFNIAQPESLQKAVALGLVCGVGFGAAITSVNAISPNMPRPGLYALVTGSYHAVGLVLVSAIQYWLT